MKKALIITILILLFSSCTKEEYGILPYQESNIEAVLQVNNEFKIKLVKNEKVTLEILEPKSLLGMTFIIEKENIIAKNGETEITLDKEKLKGIYALSRIFSLEEKNLTTAENNQFSFEQEKVHYVLTLGKNNLPKNVEISSPYFQYEITVEGISKP